MRLYLPGTVATTAGLTPTVQGVWSITSILGRAMMRTTKINDTIASVSYSDADVAAQTIIFRQWLSEELTPGQTVTGGQVWEVQCRVSETGTGNNMFLRRALFVIGGNGTTLRKTMVASSDDGLEAATSLTNRANGGTTAATNYTTVAGDRLLLELGMSGDPAVGNSHGSSMSFGDSAATDLPSADDADTGVKNPFLNLADNLTFVPIGKPFLGIEAVHRGASF